jgi:DNA helicase-2/ATP-dependent DNA helicase PcrA
MQFPLNPAQASAVEHQNGPILILAGAGSGKTRVITQRIARLLSRGIPPSAILALTFTNKAAGEMNERVHSLLHGGARAPHAPGAAGSQSPRRRMAPLDPRQVTITTFHSFGLGVLTKERAAVGGSFTIFDQGDALGAVKEILRTIDAGRRLDAAAVLARISNAKNAFLTTEELPDREGDEYDEITRLVYPRYEAALRGFRAYDFDDLVCGTARLWRERPDILARWRERYRYLLVDEYQDTNRAQLEMLLLLAGDHKNICVVGDDDQSIYAWRGADVKNILEFEDQFAGAVVVKLEQNYRSRAPIIAVANAVIAKKVDQRHKKTLFTERGGEAKVRAVVAPTPDVEAAWVSRQVDDLIRGDHVAPDEIAILYRSNGQSAPLEEALRERGVPHRVLGGQQFFERKEVKDLLAYLKVALNSNDDISLRRIINYPARGIGDGSLEKLALHALAKGWTLWQAVERVDALDDVPAGAREGCRALERLMNETRDDLHASGASAAAAVRRLAERIALREEVDASSPSGQIAARRWANVESLLASFQRREARAPEGSEGEWIGSFVQALTLEQGKDDEDARPKVTLCTLHGAKGLEFDHVFLLGCEEGLLPHSRTLDARATDASPQDIEEERRLFYVGVTRAKEQLTLSRAATRPMRGKAVPRTPSRFLLEIPEELLEQFSVKDEPARPVASLEAGASALLAALDALG